MTIYLPFVASLLISGVCSWIIYLYGPKWGLMDIANGRSSHKGAIPTGAGVGMPVVYAVVSIYLNMPVLIWIPIVFVSFFSLVGDRTDLSVKIRLVVQFLCAAAVCTGWILESGDFYFPLFLFYVFFIVGTANLYNFMDGINGIAGLTAFIGFGFLAAYGAVNDMDIRFIVLDLVICGAAVGFLIFNFPRARVFMGDTGSIFIGFFFAVQIMLMARTATDFICMISFILPFYLDEVTTMSIRLKLKENLTRAHRKHLYQILANELAIPQWKITMGFALSQTVVGLMVFLFQSGKPEVIIGIDLLFTVIFIITTFMVRKRVKNIS